MPSRRHNRHTGPLYFPMPLTLSYTIESDRYTADLIHNLNYQVKRAAVFSVDSHYAESALHLESKL